MSYTSLPRLYSPFSIAQVCFLVEISYFALPLLYILLQICTRIHVAYLYYELHYSHCQFETHCGRRPMLLLVKTVLCKTLYALSRQCFIQRVYTLKALITNLLRG